MMPKHDFNKDKTFTIDGRPFIHLGRWEAHVLEELWNKYGEALAEQEKARGNTRIAETIATNVEFDAVKERLAWARQHFTDIDEKMAKKREERK